MAVASLAFLGITSTFGFLVSLILFSLLTLLVVLKWQRREIDAFGATLPGPKAYPIVGNALEFIGREPVEFVDMIYQWTWKYPSPFAIWFGPHLVVSIHDLENTQIVLKSNKAIEKNLLYDTFKPYFGEGLLTAPEEKWRKARKLINPAFNTKILESFIPIFNEKNRLLVKVMEVQDGKGVFDPFQYVLRMNMDVISRTALGIEMDSLNDPTHRFLEALETLSEFIYIRMYKVWLHSDFMWKHFGPKKEIKRMNDYVYPFMDNIIAEVKKEYQERKKTKPPKEAPIEEKRHVDTFIDILLELADSGIAYTNSKELRDEVMTMFAAGMDTSAITNCFTLLMLGMHPEIQEKVYEEVMEVVGDRDVTMEDLNQLVYVEMVIKETMRMFPVGSILVRKTKEPLQLTNCVIPANCSISLSPYRLHHTPELFPEPDKFDPERFTPEKCAARHPFSYIPFSAGFRGCIGQRYAMMSMKVTVANIVRSYRIESPWTDPEKIILKVDVLLKSYEGYPITIKKRH